MNVKPGDLAIVTKAGNPENIGKLVRVVGEAPYGHPSGLFAWAVESTSISKLYSMGGEYTYPAGFVGACPDAWLRPVSGIPDEQHTEEENKVTA